MFSSDFPLPSASISKIFKNTLKDTVQKEIIDKLDFIKIKNFCFLKDNIKRMRGQATDWDEIFAKTTSYKELLSKIYKEVLNSTPSKKTADLKMGQRP